MLSFWVEYFLVKLRATHFKKGAQRNGETYQESRSIKKDVIDTQTFQEDVFFVLRNRHKSLIQVQLHVCVIAKAFFVEK